MMWRSSGSRSKIRAASRKAMPRRQTFAAFLAGSHVNRAQHLYEMYLPLSRCEVPWPRSRLLAVALSLHIVRHDDRAAGGEHAADAVADRDLGAGDLGRGDSSHLAHAPGR